MKENLKVLRKWLLRVGSLIGIILLSLQLYRTYLAFRMQEIAILGHWQIPIAIIVIIVSIFLQIRAWWFLMGNKNIRLTLITAQFGYSFSFLARYIPGTVWGYISRSEWLYQDYQVSYFYSNYVSFLEIIASILGGVVAIGVGIILKGYSFEYIAVGLLFVLVPLFLWFPSLSNFQFSLKNMFVSWLKKEELTDTPTFRAWWTALLLWLINWFLYGLSLFFIGVSLGAWNFSQLPVLWASLTTVYSIAWFIGFIIIFIPSGLGVRELALSYLLIRYFHLDSGVAQGISILMRFSMTVAELISIAIFAILKRIFSKGV